MSTTPKADETSEGRRQGLLDRLRGRVGPGGEEITRKK